MGLCWLFERHLQCSVDRKHERGPEVPAADSQREACGGASCGSSAARPSALCVMDAMLTAPGSPLIGDSLTSPSQRTRRTKKNKRARRWHKHRVRGWLNARGPRQTRLASESAATNVDASLINAGTQSNCSPRFRSVTAVASVTQAALDSKSQPLGFGGSDHCN